jgi:hypothetical protein
MISEYEKPFNKAIPIIREKYQLDLEMVFKEQKWREVSCYFEFYGPSSFAGQHNFEEEMTATLIDVNPYKEGMLPPDKFIKYFKHLDIPNILYEGYITTEIIDQVKNSTLPRMTFEGVVAKGTENGKQVMFKVKSKAWLDKLKTYCTQILYKNEVHMTGWPYGPAFDWKRVKTFCYFCERTFSMKKNRNFLWHPLSPKIACTFCENDRTSILQTSFYYSWVEIRYSLFLQHTKYFNYETL